MSKRATSVGTRYSVSLLRDDEEILAPRLPLERDSYTHLLNLVTCNRIKLAQNYLYPSASFGGIYGLCLGGSVLSVIEFGYLIARQFFRKRLCRRSKDQLFANLPPASEIFLSIPVEEIQRPRDQQEVNDNRFFVTWQQPTTLQRRRTIMKLDDVRRKRGKF